jgi:type I restriction enzyme S subunit
MGRLARRVTVGHVGPMKDEYVPHGIPFLRSQNVREDRFDSRGLLFISPSFHERLSKSRLTPGDVVIVRSGNVGTACVVPNALGESNCADLVIVQGPEALDPRYAALYMNSLARARVRAGRVGVALTHFNTQSVAELPVPVPPLEEQRRIVAEAERLMSVVDSLEKVLEDGLTRAATLRVSILAAAFSGKLVRQEPDDKPAGILLERVAGDVAVSKRPRSKALHAQRKKVTA